MSGRQIWQPAPALEFQFRADRCMLEIFVRGAGGRRASLGVWDRRDKVAVSRPMWSGSFVISQSRVKAVAGDSVSQLARRVRAAINQHPRAIGLAMEYTYG